MVQPQHLLLNLISSDFLDSFHLSIVKQLLSFEKSDWVGISHTTKWSKGRQLSPTRPHHALVVKKPREGPYETSHWWLMAPLLCVFHTFGGMVFSAPTAWLPPPHVNYLGFIFSLKLESKVSEVKFKKKNKTARRLVMFYGIKYFF